MKSSRLTVLISVLLITANIAQSCQIAIAADVSTYELTDEHIAYIIGYDDLKIKPENNITRAETAAMFYRLLKAKNSDVTISFPDVNIGDWFYESVEKLAALGIISGYEDGSFAPQKPITRAEFVSIAVHFSEQAKGTVLFDDVPAEHWAAKNIALSYGNGWINGYEDGLFKPENNITRAEAAVIINKITQRSADKEFIDANADTVTQFSDLKDITKWYYYDLIIASTENDLVFLNKSSVKRIYYRGGENNYLDVSKGVEDYIELTDSTVYSPELSYMLMGIAWSAYNNQERQSSESSEDFVLDGTRQPCETDEEKKDTNIYRTLDSLGFEDISLMEYYIDPQDKRYGDDNSAYTIAHKTLTNGNNLVIVAVAGSYGPMDKSSDWKSNLNFDLSENNNHAGFESAALKVHKDIKSYISANDLTNNVYVLTGHSRGAAVANLVATMLDDEDSSSHRVYDYNFACPNLTGNLDKILDYPNIFNICNRKDLVSILPPEDWSWSKYGTTLWFDADASVPDIKVEEGSLLFMVMDTFPEVQLITHAQSEYFNYLKKLIPASGYETDT